MSAQLKATLHRAWYDAVADDSPDASWLEQEGFEDRLEQFRNGDFHLIGVRAGAEIRFKTEQNGWITGTTIYSPGVYGIESDSDEAYIAEVAIEQAHELALMLQALAIYISQNDVAALVLDSADFPVAS